MKILIFGEKPIIFELRTKKGRHNFLLRKSEICSENWNFFRLESKISAT